MHGKFGRANLPAFGRGLLMASVVVTLTGCVSTRAVHAPTPGHPANAESASVAFSPLDNPFAHRLVPTSEPGSHGDDMDMHGMPGISHDSSGSTSEGGLTVYTCPMHADVRSDRPGTCPKCGMQLVPSKASQSPHDHGGNP